MQEYGHNYAVHSVQELHVLLQDLATLQEHASSCTFLGRSTRMTFHNIPPPVPYQAQVHTLVTTLADVDVL